MIVGVLVVLAVVFIIGAQEDGAMTPAPAAEVGEAGNRMEEREVSDVARETEPETTTVNSGTVLNLSNQGLTRTPNSVFAETSLRELNLSNNNLDGSLQAEIRNLQALRVLDLSENEFTGVPAEIGQLKNLEILDLSNNNLTGLPHELGNLSNLKVLDLSGNDYSAADLAVIKSNLSGSVVIEVD